jgi:hypothetical protein
MSAMTVRPTWISVLLALEIPAILWFVYWLIDQPAKPSTAQH